MSAIGIQDSYEDILVRTRNNSIDEQQNYVQYINDDIKNDKNHKSNSTRSKSSSKKDYAHEKPFLITHVTLALDDLNNDPSYPVPTWRYNSIRRNPSSSSNYNSHNNSNRLINHPNRKYFHKSFFLTGLSDDLETQQRNTNNEIEQRNRIEQKRTKSIKRQKNDLEENSSTHSSENEIDEQHIQHISPVNKKTHNSSAHNINSASINSSIISSSNKNRPKFKGENFFIDLSRGRTSLGEASIASNETGRISGRNSGRNSYTVAEFNRFKNSLLKYHSKNELNHIASQSSVYKSQQIPQSTIKSIYEAVERENRSKNYSVDVKRSNYLKTLKKTEALLASSLVIKKLN